MSADSILPSHANPQALNRYSYVLNNPVKLIDPTGHRCVDQNANGNTMNVDCDTGTTTGLSTPSSDGKIIHHHNNSGKDDHKFVEIIQNYVNRCIQNPQGCIPTPAQCTSSPCIGNLVPSVTPTPTETPLPLIDSNTVKDWWQYAKPSIFPSFAPGIDDVWHNIANGVPPVFGVPGIDVYAKRIVDNIPNAIETAYYVLVNHSAYMINGGISPTIPMVPYFPSANPFATVYQ